ncbi:PREDICTED: SWI/SNF complex subunit SMARCC2-like [Priapulus caudatus]|uniref:SWI/SNF complex subunit SMARCC2-like n=1 Tax=Priapulus caudatus TaxID=37621 RepID=A0ABM1F0W1_PRICU|nr:PREDICTED: SWI/SNF complex subunit SMARCC2-like [Priapulus caudatus]
MVIIRKKDGTPNIKFFESPETVSHFDAIRSWLQRNYKKLYSPKQRYLQEWIRPIIKRDSAILLHWWFTPDSYDTWMTGVEVEQEPASPVDEAQKLPYEVNARWILDTDEYNEWMNEEDYKVHDTWSDREGRKDCGQSSQAIINVTEAERKRKLSKSRRKRSPSPTERKPKRKSSRGCAVRRREAPKEEEEEEDLTKDMEEPAPEPKMSEVIIPKHLAKPLFGKETEWQPVKGGALAELDDESSAMAASDAAAGGGGGGGDTKVPGLAVNDCVVSMTRLLQVDGKVEADETKGEDEGGGGGVKEEDEGKDSEGEDNLTEQTNHVVVPSYTSWFDYNGIHSIEKRALPEFFNMKNVSKTPEVYMAYRNFMIDTYRLNPLEYLTSTACRRNLPGDVCSITRVHAFLEQWGLINYQVDAECRPAPMGPPPTSHFMVLSDVQNTLQPTAPKPSSQSASAQMMSFREKEEPREEATPTSYGLKTDQYCKQIAAMKSRAGMVPMSREWTDQETLMLLLHTPLHSQPIPFSRSGNPVMSTVAFLASVVDPRIASSAAKAAMDAFCKLRDEVSPGVLEAHLRRVRDHAERTGIVDPRRGLDKTSIAGTEAEPPEGATGTPRAILVTGVPGMDSEDSLPPSSTPPASLGSSPAGVEVGADFTTVVDIKQEPADRADSTDSDAPSTPHKDAEAPPTSSGVETEAPSTPTTDSEAPPGTPTKEVVARRTSVKDRKINEGEVQAAAAAALSVAATKAKHLASVEERNIKTLVAQLVETQMKKLEIKLRHFYELENVMEQEQETRDRGRKRVG